MRGMQQWMKNEKPKRVVYDAVIKAAQARFAHYPKRGLPTLAGLCAEDLRDPKLFLPYCSLIDVFEIKFQYRKTMESHLRQLSSRQQKKINIYSNNIKHSVDIEDYDILWLDTTWMPHTVLQVFEENWISRLNDCTMVLGAWCSNRDRMNEVDFMDRIQTIALKHGVRVPHANSIQGYPSNEQHPWLAEMIFARFDFLRT